MSGLLSAYCKGESGATTVDWVVLTASVTGMGLATAATVSGGLEDLSGDIRAALTGYSIGSSFSGGMDAASTAAAVGLINGGLDSNQRDGTWSLSVIDGWTNSGSGGRIETWGNTFLGYSTNDGSSFIELDATRSGLDFVSTEVDMETGVSYALTFEHAARRGGGVNDDFEVVVNGEVVAVVSPQSTDSFTSTTLIIQGQEGADQIGFREIPSQNNSVGILLDSVELVQQ